MTWQAQFGGESTSPEDESTIVAKVKEFLTTIETEWAQLTTTHHGSGALTEVSDTPVEAPVEPTPESTDTPAEPATDVPPTPETLQA